MKKILLASAALIVGGAFSAQAAEPLKLSVGGWMLQQVAYIDQDIETGNLDQQSYGQVNFAASTKLDNGLTIGVDVHTYATQGSDSRNATGARNAGQGNSNVRRAWITLGSAYGQLLLGQREDYGAIVHNKAPDVGWGLADGDWQDYFSFPTNHNLYLLTDNSRYSVRADRITLITPTWEGFNAGFTYTPDVALKRTGGTSIYPGGIDGDAIASGDILSVANRGSLAGDQYLVGVSYRNQLGQVGVRGDLAYSAYDIGNLRTYQAGLQIAYAGFTLGGSYFYRDVGSSDTVRINTPASGGNPASVAYVPAKGVLHAGHSYDVAVSYQAKDFGVSFGYFHDQSKGYDIAANNPRNASSTSDVFALSAAYTMGPGVQWKNSLYYADFDNTGSGVANKNDGILFVSGLFVAF
ncbi:porin [Alphaproteobacteria bacterium]|nr:porin [Alphaproteobacteria bacterium]